MPSMENKWTYQTVEAVNEEDKKDGQLSEWCTLFKTGFQCSETEITEMLGVLFEGLHKIKKMIVKQTGMVFNYNVHSCKEGQFTRHYWINSYQFS